MAEPDPLQRYAERLASVFTAAGFPRMAARVLMALMMSPDAALTAAELKDRLGISSGAVSGAVKYLETVGMVRRRAHRGPGARRGRQSHGRGEGRRDPDRHPSRPGPEGVRVMTGRTVDHDTARRAAIVATIWVPLAIVVVALMIVIRVGSSSGRDLIVHWGSSGQRTGPWWTYAVLVAATGCPVIALIGFFIVRATRMTGANTWMPAIAMGITVFHAVGMGVGSVVLNASPLAPALPLAGGALLAAAAAVLTWRLLPQEALTAETVQAADALPVRSGEVVAWTGRVELPAWFMAIIAAAAAVLIVLGVSLLLTIGPRLWPILLAPALLLAVLLLTAQFVATTGPRGFVVRSAMGWPRLRIPAADLAKAGVVAVDPLADFGGWHMPIEYASSGGGVLKEHAAVREAVGVFDVSHLGKAVVRGPGAAAFVNACLSNDLGRIVPGKAQYPLCCDETGGVVDDLIAYLVGEDEVFLVPNAANTAELVRRLVAAAPPGVVVQDQRSKPETPTTCSSPI